ncbi:MAG: ABC transporter permease [Synechococcaceae cyanobacterium]
MPSDGILSIVPSRLGGRAGLGLLVLGLTALALLPLIGLAQQALAAGGGTGLGPEGWRQLSNTALLVLAVGLGSGLLGCVNAWLSSACSFPGRRWLRPAQLLPLATPAYLLAATVIDLGSRLSWQVQGLGWAALVLVLATYSYVFLLASESFANLGRQPQEVCRSLGLGPWSFWVRVALPLALPAIGAGIALAGMEVVNDLGAVELLGVPTLSVGILQRWQSDGDPAGAVGLALLALLIVTFLVGGERWLRRRSRRWVMAGGRDRASAWRLRGWRALAALLLTLLPPLLCLGLPLLWALCSLDQLRPESWSELGALLLRSLGLGLGATALTLTAGLLLAEARRWLRQPLLLRLCFVAGMGYALPGAVLALGLLLVGNGLGLNPLALLCWGYAVRFLAVSKQGLDAAFEQLPPSLDEAATVLGCSWTGVLRRVHLPLMRGPLLVGALLVFVDVVKELPLTLALRPFDFDTLPVRVFQYASDERLGAALLPALLILVLGLVAALALMPGLPSHADVLEDQLEDAPMLNPSRPSDPPST